MARRKDKDHHTGDFRMYPNPADAENPWVLDDGTDDGWKTAVRQVEIDYNNCPFLVTENDFTNETKAWLRGRAEVSICDFGGPRLASLSGYDEDGRLAMIPGPDEIKEANRKKMGFKWVGNHYMLVKVEDVAPQERKRLEGILLQNMRQSERDLRRALAEANDKESYEDAVFGYYHGSLKVFGLQRTTQRMADALAAIAPEGRPFCAGFSEIIRHGTRRRFPLSELNRHWPERALPIIQAFFHVRYFAEMAVKYAKLAKPPKPLPSGFAALLELYGIA